MNNFLVRLAGCGLALGGAAVAFAQPQLPVQLRVNNPWTFSFGLRHTAGGGDVTFSNLGAIAPSQAVGPNNTDRMTRVYDDGAVILDASRTARPSEANAQFSEDGLRYAERYESNLAGQATTYAWRGDYLAFQESQTRRWAYDNASQLTGDGRVAFHAYSSTSAGAQAEAEGSGSPGFEMALARRIGRLGERAEWGLSVSFGLADIRAKTSGRIAANLVTLTDYYSLLGATAPAAPYNAPTFVDILDAQGNVQLAQGRETTVPLGQSPLAGQRTETVSPGAATIDGNWEMKGAYFVSRIGPTVRFRLTQRIAVVAGAGFAGAFAGTDFRSDETLVFTDGRSSVRRQEEDEESKFLPGFYGEVAAEYWFNNRTGLYVGAAYESFGDYEQTLGGRTAKVDIGSGIAARVGLVTRF